MKYFVIAVALIASVAASAIRPTQVSGDLAQIGQIINAINHPSTDPATAALLQEMLLSVIGSSPVSVGPAIIEEHPIVGGPAIVDHPIVGGPAIIDHPIVGGPAIIDAPISTLPALVDFPINADGEVIIGSPAVVPPVIAEEATPAAQSAPLVQIILNINAAAPEVVGVAPAPVPEIAAPGPVIIVDDAPTPVIVVDDAPTPVIVVDDAPVPVIVVDAAPEPVIVVDAAPEPVIVVDSVPAPEPVVVGTPNLPVAVVPAPAVVVPEILN